MISSITVSELDLYSNIEIIDIRSTQNYNNNHIDGATNIPFEKIISNPIKYLDKSKKYFIYCQKGITSLKVCKILGNQGFKVINIKGGYEEWILNK